MLGCGTKQNDNTAIQPERTKEGPFMLYGRLYSAIRALSSLQWVIIFILAVMMAASLSVAIVRPAGGAGVALEAGQLHRMRAIVVSDPDVGDTASV